MTDEKIDALALRYAGTLTTGGGLRAFARAVIFAATTDDRNWAARGRWLVEKLTERCIPDGRCVLEISEEPIWCKPDGTLADYIAAVDLAMERDESRAEA